MINGAIYVFGGCNESGDVNTTEKYNKATDEWEILDTMQFNEMMKGVFTIKGIPLLTKDVNDEEYDRDGDDDSEDSWSTSSE